MIPPDVAPSDLSIFTLFWQAHWIVKSVMIGLMACSVWVWAIAVDKTILYSRTSRAMDGFEQSFWSGQSLEELYRMVSSRPNHSMAALFVAAMQEWKRSFEGPTRSFTGLQMRIEKVMDVTIMREIERLGHHDEFPIDCSFEKYVACGGCAGHCGGPVRHRDRARGRHTGDHFLQQVQFRSEQAGATPGGVRGRVRRHSVAADRRA